MTNFTLELSVAYTDIEFVISVPNNYSYLQESSILRAIVDFLLMAGKKGTCIY